MSAPTAATAHIAVARPNPVSVGTMVWLASELMFFAGLFAMYFSIRASSPNLWAARTELLNVPFAAANTAILVTSSVTCQLGVFAAERFQQRRTGSLLNLKAWGLNEWFMLTFVLGSIFVAGQVTEYAQLVSEGGLISTDSYFSAFYLTTGFHALHVTAGLVAFLLVMGRSFLAKRFGAHEATSAIVTSYYWHFVDVVWLGLFLVIYVMK